MEEHNGSRFRKEAKNTRARQPVEPVYSEEYTNRSSVFKREYEIKKDESRG